MVAGQIVAIIPLAAEHLVRITARAERLPVIFRARDARCCSKVPAATGRCCQRRRASLHEIGGVEAVGFELADGRVDVAGCVALGGD